MSAMRSIVVDKIASVTQACGLSHEIRVAADIVCEEGLVVVVEILNNKSTYNTLELTSGRMAKLARGDVGFMEEKEVDSEVFVKATDRCSFASNRS